jgi:GTP1/Obg family GTP-binding protein
MTGGESSGDSLTANRSIVRNASLRVERDAPEEGPAQAVALAKSHGGYAELVTREGATVRIPAERLDAFLAAVPTLGQVEDQSISAVDVTDSHRDLKIRLAHLETMRARYQSLLERAANVSEAVLVEKELERVTAEYESIKARLQSLEGQVALATVHVDFARPVRPGPVGWVFYGLAKGIKWLFIWE